METSNSIESIIAAILQEDAKMPAPKGFVAYGTSGFRTLGSELVRVAYRLAVLCWIKSASLGGIPLGFMITASHNPAQDNGLKIAYEKGGNPNSDLEAEFSQFCNTDDFESLLRSKLNSTVLKGSLVIGYDTRETSPILEKAVIAAMEATKCKFKSYGCISWPELNFLSQLNQEAFSMSKSIDYFDFVDVSLYSTYVKDFFFQAKESLDTIIGKKASSNKAILVDCSNGVATHKQPIIKEILDKLELPVKVSY